MANQWRLVQKRVYQPKEAVGRLFWALVLRPGLCSPHSGMIIMKLETIPCQKSLLSMEYQYGRAWAA